MLLFTYGKQPVILRKSDIMEQFAIPGVGGIIEKQENNEYYILIQQRYKDDNSCKEGLLEIPAGKIRQFENIYDCLRREVQEETGLEVVEISGENESELIRINDYTVLNYTPFSCSQNLNGTYPIMVEVFLCTVTGFLPTESSEARNIKWITLNELNKLMESNIDLFYPMHISTLRKYLNYRFHKD